MCVTLVYTSLYHLRAVTYGCCKKAYCHVESYNCICLYQLNLNMELANPGTWKHRMLWFPNHWSFFQDCILIKWFMTSFTGTNWSQSTICWTAHSWKEFADVLTNGDPKLSCFKFDQALKILATFKREAESWEEN